MIVCCVAAVVALFGADGGARVVSGRIGEAPASFGNIPAVTPVFREPEVDVKFRKSVDAAVLKAEKKRDKGVSVIRVDKLFTDLQAAIDTLRIMEADARDWKPSSYTDPIYASEPVPEGSRENEAEEAAPVRKESAEAALSNDVRFLCDSLRGGRASGTAEAAEVAILLRQRFLSSGLQVHSPSFACTGGHGRNVIGVRRRGSRRCIVILAHYDGLVLPGGHYPGADSNASGVAALLSLASSFQSSDSGPDLVFVALDGHNDSLSGAGALIGQLEALGYSTRDIVLAVNLDILGCNLAPVHKCWSEYIIALGGSRWSGSIVKCNSGLGLHIYYDYYGSRAFTDMFYRRVSDHRPLLERGVPCVMFTSGITMNTNKTSDTPETLNYPLLVRRIELVRRWLASF
ncbi:MAG: M28 family peptidase [Bacteroidales bacterium]|nr:M28 family peptidase [Bacteroidales bacterium]